MLSSLIGPSASEAKMTLSVSGKRVGTAMVRKSVASNGVVTESAHMTINSQGKTVHDDYDVLVDKAGRPMRKTRTQSLGALRLTYIASYGPKEVKVTVTQGSKTVTRSSPIPKGNLEDSSNLWFATIHPKPGASTTYLDFNIREFKWQTRTTRYVGDETVPGTHVKGHHVRSDEGDEWLDDHGLPYRMDMKTGNGNLVLQRQ